jgi:FecR protein/Putative zinc-finger
MFSRHVTKDISAYCHGELSSEESKQFAEHLIGCAKCRTRFEEVKLGIKLAEQLPRLSAPEHLWEDLEPLLGEESTGQTEVRWAAPRRRPLLAVTAAAALILIAGFAGLWIFYNRPEVLPGPPDITQSTSKSSWLVKALNGTPKIGSEEIANDGQWAIGEWLETDGNSRARIAVGSIGNVDIDENTRVRLLATQPTEHRLELVRGKMSARIWAPPRLFFVDTPSAVAADLGCAYTLEVDENGGSLLRVTSGWVALQLKDRESMVPQGAACETQPGIGPGTPYFEDAPAGFRDALRKIDFSDDQPARSDALSLMLSQSRPRDTLTLWHLLARVNGEDRVRVYEKMAAYAPPPQGVTREGVLQLNQEMLETWRHELEWSWIGGSKTKSKTLDKALYKLKTKMRDMVPK